MIYDDMDRLWGEMKPIDEEYLVGLADGQSVEFGDAVFRLFIRLDMLFITMLMC